jgi:hypothetical protein
MSMTASGWMARCSTIARRVESPRTFQTSLFDA